MKMDMELGGQKNSGYLEAFLLGEWWMDRCGGTGEYAQMYRRMGGESLDRRTGRLGRGSTRHKKPFPMSSFFMLPTPLHPTLQE